MDLPYRLAIDSVADGLFYHRSDSLSVLDILSYAAASSTQMPFTSAALLNSGRAYLPLYEGYALVSTILFNTIQGVFQNFSRDYF
jgi:hypothetical protein